MYDCAIIGTGAAGVSAALTLKALKRNFILIGNAALSHKIRSAEKIKNYPALTQISGGELCGLFQKQLKAEGIEITEGKVNGVYPSEDYYTVIFGKESVEARTVILACGVETVKPVVGEREFLGRGVSYCAVCDGFLYRDKTIAVVAENLNAETLGEVRLLSEYARTVYLFCRRGAVGTLPENVIFKGGAPSEVKGDMRARTIAADGEELAVDGVFFLKESVAAETLVHGLKCERGLVVVNRACATNLAGVFAAGDITGRPYQYAKAVGEGNVCAYSVNDYLNAVRREK